MLMAEVDTGNVQQVTVAFWVACCTLPDCESQARELLRAFVQLLPDATAPSVVLVLSCVQAAEWEYVPWGRLKQLLLAAEQLLLEMSARQIATILLCTSCRNLGFQFGVQLHAFHNAFVERLPTATVSDICGVCWAAAVTGRRLHFRSIGPMMDRVLQQLPAVTPVQASMLLWSLATMRITLREGDHVHQLVAVALANAVRGAAAGNKVNVVLLKKITWAAAIIGQPLPLEQLQQIEAAWVDVWSCARAAEQSQQVSTFEALCTALWSFAQLLYYPKNLLTVITKNKKLFEQCMKSASTQHLSMAVVAYAALGPVGGFPWYAAVRRVNQLGIKAVGCQTAANLCWALVVRARKLPRDGSKVDQLAAACASVWQDVGRAERQQLLHVHVLLKHLGQKDCRRSFGGLSGVLSARQLADCSAAWEPGANEPSRFSTSKLQQQVYDLLLQLPDSTWQREGGAPVLEQLAADGISSIDIAATRQDGLRLAIEVDGPNHFLRPDNTLDGRTKCRNRLLQAQGWTTVSIPYFEFQAVPADQPEQQLQYLAQKVQRADADIVHW